MLNTDHISTTHTGSLPRPRLLLDLLRDRELGSGVDEPAFRARLAESVAECVRAQVDAGVEVVTDGEQGKLGFSNYMRSRLSGLEELPERRTPPSRDEVEFPEFYSEYFEGLRKHRVLPRGPGLVAPVHCVGPVSYTGQEDLQRDISNLQTAMTQAGASRAFMPATNPRAPGENDYYDTREEYQRAVAEAVREEYTAILAAGLDLQIDDPGCARVLSVDRPGVSDEEVQRAERYIELYNDLLEGLPQDRIRLHVCYGVNAGPKVHDPNIGEFARSMVRINVGGYSFEASNPRHFHEWHVWEDVDLPDDRVLLPGVISHGSNNLEHPEFVAEQIQNYAKLVGRERVIASTDCGFSSQATYETEVHPTIVWAKLESLHEGAGLATRRLWAKG